MGPEKHGQDRLADFGNWQSLANVLGIGYTKISRDSHEERRIAGVPAQLVREAAQCLFRNGIKPPYPLRTTACPQGLLVDEHGEVYTGSPN